MTSQRDSRPDLDETDVAAAADAAALTVAHSVAVSRRNSGTAADWNSGQVVRAQMREAVAAAQRHSVQEQVTGPRDWTGFGQVVPVVSGCPGAGASVLTAVIADVLQVNRRQVLVVDAADPRRSGLTSAARSDGPRLSTAHSAVWVRHSWRSQAVLARLETSLPVIAPGMVPPPHQWLGPLHRPDATVVDIGHDPWRATAHPLVGVGAWLLNGQPPPRPVLVVRATRPALRHAEHLLARLDAWLCTGVVAPMAQLIVMAEKRWPAKVRGAAGRFLGPLLDGAIFVPEDAGVRIGGVSDSITPARLRNAVSPLLRQWGLIPAAGRQGGRS